MIRGVKLKKTRLKKCSNHISVAFPNNKLHILVAINKIVKSRTLKNISRSQLMIDAVEMFIGNVNTTNIEKQILSLYKSEEIIGPKRFKTFSDIFAWEIREKSITDIIRLWAVSKAQMAFLFYRYLHNLKN